MQSFHLDFFEDHAVRIFLCFIFSFSIWHFVSSLSFAEAKDLLDNFGSDSYQEREYFPDEFEGVYLNLGEARSYSFLMECDGFGYDFPFQLSALPHEIKCAGVDLNDDDRPDVVIKIEGDKCQNSLCPTYFFIKRDDVYERLKGPLILGDGFAVTSLKTGQFRSFIFKSDVMGLCVWHLSGGPEQDYMCTISAPLKKTP